VFGWLRGKEADVKQSLDAALEHEPTSATNGPTTSTSPSNARAPNTATSKRQEKAVADRAVAAEKKLSLRRGTVWPRFKNVPRVATEKNPRHYPPSLDLLSQNSSTLSAEERKARFETLLTHVADRVGRKPKVDDALQLRDSSWNQLIQLAESGEQLERVAELMPHWVDMKRDFKTSLWTLFIGEHVYSYGL
jgi:hypothetical protein